MDLWALEWLLVFTDASFNPNWQLMRTTFSRSLPQHQGQRRWMHKDAIFHDLMLKYVTLYIMHFKKVGINNKLRLNADNVYKFKVTALRSKFQYSLKMPCFTTLCGSEWLIPFSKGWTHMINISWEFMRTTFLRKHCCVSFFSIF